MFLLLLLIPFVFSNELDLQNHNKEFLELYHNDYILDNSFNKSNILNNFTSLEKCKNTCLLKKECLSDIGCPLVSIDWFDMQCKSD